MKNRSIYLLFACLMVTVWTYDLSCGGGDGEGNGDGNGDAVQLEPAKALSAF